MESDVLRAARAVGDALRAAGYTDRRVARALGMLSWRSHDLDNAWWEHRNCAEGRMKVLVDLLIRGERRPLAAALDALPGAAWEAGLLEDDGREAWATGTVLPMDEDLIWTDRADECEEPDGLFLPDSTTLALRRCLPPTQVDRHLDMGAGAGAVTVRAARRARQTVALDLNPRSEEACLLTAALSGIVSNTVNELVTRTGRAEALRGERFDRLTFVLPLLVPMPRHVGGSVHTIAEAPSLLVDLLEALPALMAPGALALLYTQEHAEGRSLERAVAEAFGDRSWRGVFWCDHEGDDEEGEPRAGVLALRADAAPGWDDVEREEEPEGESWWPALAALLGER